MKILHVLIFGLVSLTSVGQIKTFSILPVSPDKTEKLYDSLDIFETYVLNRYTFFVGRTQKKFDSPQTTKIIIQNESGKVIFSKRGQIDSYIFRPTFFSTGMANDPLIILVESGSEYSWGNNVIKVNRDAVEELGYLDVATWDSIDNKSSDIAQWTRIQVQDGVFSFKFDAQYVIYNIEGKKEKIYEGWEICYYYRNGQLTMETPCR